MASQSVFPQAVTPSSTVWKTSLSEAFSDLERSANKFWRLVDEYAALCATYQDEEMSKSFRDLRQAYETSLDVLDAIRKCTKDMNTRAEKFNHFIEGFETRVSLTSLDYGLNLIPDELLADVLFHAASTIEGAVALSHVCRRFRSTVLSCRKIWTKFPLTSRWNSDQILAVAERSGYNSLTACVIQGYRVYGLTQSTRTLFSLSPYLSELRISYLDDLYAAEIQNILNGSTMPVLSSLEIDRAECTGPISYHCHFYEACDMPLLQNLVTTIAPRPPLAKCLVRCTLRFIGRVRLKEYLDFLSSAEGLRELVIEIHSEAVLAGGHNNALQLVTLPRLEIFEIAYEWTMYDDPLNHLLVEKIRPSSIRQLNLRAERVSEEFRILLEFLNFSSSLLELSVEFSGILGWLCIDEFLADLPPQLESLSVTAQCELSMGSSHVFRAYNLRRIHFSFVYSVSEDVVQRLRRYFQDAGHTKVIITFTACPGANDGTYRLDTLETALISTW